MQKQKSNPYKKSDEFREKLKKEIRREFNRLDVLAFDELSVVHTKEVVEGQYERLSAFNEKQYLKIVEDAQKKFSETYLLPDEREKTKGVSAMLVLLAVLAGYDTVTGYVYKHEVERKRMRQLESMLAAKEGRNRAAYHDALRKAANLWYTQSAQYGDNMVDAAEMRMMSKAGIKYVQWVTKHDGVVCHKCDELDGTVWKIEEAPSKQHYNCRCRLIPYRKEDTE